METKEIKDYCPGCHSSYDEVWSNGLCSCCDIDLAAARAEPRAQELKKLHQRLVDLYRMSQIWGAENGWPAVRDYPQFTAIYAVGSVLYERGRHSAMDRALGVIAEEIEGSGRGAARFVEFAWAGIGGWAP